MALLCDRLCAMAGTPEDRGLCGAYTHLAASIREAQRFVIEDVAVVAAEQVRRTKPSSLLAAIGLARPPFPTVWLEWVHDAKQSAQGWVDPQPRAGTIVPRRVGCLVIDHGGWCGMTFAWDFRDMDQAMIGPMGVLTSYQLELPRVVAENRDVLAKVLADAPEGHPGAAMLKDLLSRTVDHERLDRDEMIRSIRESDSIWPNLSDDEIEAALRLQEGYITSTVAPAMIEMVSRVHRKAQTEPAAADRLAAFLNQGIADIQGEPMLVTAMLLLMNSRNAVDHVPTELAKLNRARAKRGKTELLGHSVVRLNLSRVQARRAGLAGPGQPVRLHLVRGHFKVRRTGVYWWSHFVRGSRTAGMVQRDRYVVGA